MNLGATTGTREVTMHLDILRAVPCFRHAEHVFGCPDCLTGEQARAAGFDNKDGERHLRWTSESEGRVRWQKIARRFSRS